MHLNSFADGLAPFDMTNTDEFRSLTQSAGDLGVSHGPDIRYQSHNTVLQHRRFHYLEWGNPGKPPIVLLHGGHQSAHSWDLVSLHLSDRFRLLALDQRGHGDSEWSRDGEYSMDAMASDAIDFIESQKLDKPLVFGHSMGGLVTMTVLKQRPDLVGAAILVDVGPETAGEGVRTIQDFVQSAGEFDRLDDFVARVQSYDPFRSKEHIERTVHYNLMLRADGKYVSKCDGLRGGISRDATASRAATRSISLEDAGKFPCPTLVVRGEQSNILEPDAARRFAATLPKGTLVTVPKCGHNVHSQNTIGFLEAIAPFLEANAPAGAPSR